MLIILTHIIGHKNQVFHQIKMLQNLAISNKISEYMKQTL